MWSLNWQLEVRLFPWHIPGRGGGGENYKKLYNHYLGGGGGGKGGRIEGKFQNSVG